MREEIKFLRSKLDMFLESTSYEKSDLIENQEDYLGITANLHQNYPTLSQQPSKDVKMSDKFKRNNSVDSKPISVMSSKKGGQGRQKSHGKSGRQSKKARAIGDKIIQIPF